MTCSRRIRPFPAMEGSPRSKPFSRPASDGLFQKRLPHAQLFDGSAMFNTSLSSVLGPSLHFLSAVPMLFKGEVLYGASSKYWPLMIANTPCHSSAF